MSKQQQDKITIYGPKADGTYIEAEVCYHHCHNPLRLEGSDDILHRTARIHRASRRRSRFWPPATREA
jgi:hypothetical protein